MKSEGTTNYSSRISGNPRQHNRPVKFDVTDGYVGISSYEADGKVIDRVLLSPSQWKTLVKFVENNS